MFSIVVHVQHGRILQSSVFLPHFGVEVSEVADLLSRKDDGNYEEEIAELVNEVELTGKPAKRKALIKPGDSATVFDCSVYAFFEIDGAATVLGFEIGESWPADKIPNPNLRPNAKDPDGSRLVNDGSRLVNEDSQAGSTGKSRVSFEDSVQPSRDESMSQTASLVPIISTRAVKFTEAGPHHGRKGFRRAKHGATPVDVWVRSPSSERRDTNAAEPISAADEAKLLLACRHPSILHLIGVVTLAGNGPALIMERSACSVAYKLDEESIALTPAVRIMYQISTAITHMHELGICHCAVRAENVLLMQSVLIDPIAKLSNLSQSQRKVWRFKTDIVDFAALLYRISESKDLVPKSDGIIPKLPPLPVLEGSCKSLAQLVRDSWDGSLSFSSIASRLSDIDADMTARSPQPSSWRHAELEDVQRSEGNFGSYHL
jgi:hypothetical protein